MAAESDTLQESVNAGLSFGRGGSPDEVSGEATADSFVNESVNGSQEAGDRVKSSLLIGSVELDVG